MSETTQVKSRAKRALLACMLGLGLAMAPAICDGLPVAGSAQAFDFGKLGSSFKARKKKSSGAFGNVRIRFSIFSDATPPRKKYKTKRAKAAQKPAQDAARLAAPKPAVGIVTAYEMAKKDALASGDPAALEAANAMLRSMFPAGLDERQIASFDRLLGIEMQSGEFATHEAPLDETVGSL